MLTVAAALPRPAVAAAPHTLTLRVAHAKSEPREVDPKVADLAKQLEALKLRYVKLLDQASLELAVGASGRMQLPGKEWMVVHARQVGADGMLKLDIEVDALKFKAGVAIAPGATVAVRGPAFADGTLVLAVTRNPPAAAATP